MKTLPMIATMAALSALTQSVFVQPVLAGDDAPPPDALPMGGIITYVGNAGVVIEYGAARIAVDALYDDGPDGYGGEFAEKTAAIRAALIAGEDPYDGITDLFVTHADKDHYGPQAMTDYLTAHPGVYALVPADLRSTGDDRETPAQPVLKQVVPLAGRDGVASPVNYGANFTWRFFQVPHSDRQHFVYWFALPPFQRSVAEAAGISPQDLTVLHLGDTDDYPEDLEPHRAIFAEHETDVALVPYWLLGEPGLAELLNAGQLIGIDVPPNGQGTGASALDPDTMDWFSDPGEQRIIYKNMEE